VGYWIQFTLLNSKKNCSDYVMEALAPTSASVASGNTRNCDTDNMTCIIFATNCCYTGTVTVACG